jgi:hypothetical protein
MSRSLGKAGAGVVETTAQKLLRQGGKAGADAGAAAAARSARNASMSSAAIASLKRSSATSASAIKAGTKAAVAGTKAVVAGAAIAARACAKNPKLCMTGIASAAVAGYLTDRYLDMSEDEKKCLNMCFPEDWHDYVDGTIDAPNYKVKAGNSKTDSDLKYASYYENEGDSDALCTLDNLAYQEIEITTDSCNEYCEWKCGFDYSDVIKEAVDDGIETGKKVGTAAADAAAAAAADVLLYGGGMLGDLLKSVGIDLESFKKYGIIAGVVIFIICILSVAMKMM